LELDEALAALKGKKTKSTKEKEDHPSFSVDSWDKEISEARLELSHSVSGSDVQSAVHRIIHLHRNLLDYLEEQFPHEELADDNDRIYSMYEVEQNPEEMIGKQKKALKSALTTTG
jgi:hypothetical protein